MAKNSYELFSDVEMTILRKGMCALLSVDVIQKCKEYGIKTVYELISSDPEMVAYKCKIGYKDIISIIRVLQAQYSSPVQNAYDIYMEQLSTLAIFSTGCSRLDDLLDGGIYTGEITEFVGPPAAGKTQLCNSLVATMGIESQSSMLYIDTGGGFCCQRICEMLKNRKVDEENISEILHRIHCKDIHDLFELMQFLEDSKSYLNSFQAPAFFTNLKLIVLDSVTAIVSPHLGMQSSEGQGLLVHLAHLLKSICCDHALAVVICNNTVHGEGQTSKPALGQYWQYVPSVVLKMEKDNPDGQHYSFRCATVVKSCRKQTPVSELLKLTSYGVESES